MNQHPTLDECIDRVRSTSTNTYAATYKLLYQLHYLTLLELEEQVLGCKINEPTESAGCEKVAAFVVCSQVGQGLCNGGDRRLTGKVLKRLQSVAATMRAIPTNALSQSILLQIVRKAADFLGRNGESTNPDTRRARLEATAARKKVAMTGALMSHVYSELTALTYSPSFEQSGHSLSAKAAATALAIIAGAIGMIYVIHEAWFETESDIEAFCDEMTAHAKSLRIEEIGAEAKETMREAFVQVMYTYCRHK